jgi:hypothetical protein
MFSLITDSKEIYSAEEKEDLCGETWAINSKYRYFFVSMPANTVRMCSTHV